MHEFALYSQVEASRYEQVLQILAGITASQPVKISEQTLVYQQLRLPDVPANKRAPAKQSLPTRLAYHKVIRDLNPGNSTTTAPGQWKRRVEETPEAGVKNVISQTVAERDLGDKDLEPFQAGSPWYRYVSYCFNGFTMLMSRRFVSQHVTSGSRFVNGNVVILITRVLIPKEAAENPLTSSAPDVKNLQLYDPSGAYIVEAYLRAEDGTKMELREKATAELLSFAKSLEGAIDLHVPNRLALDSAVKV